MIDQKQELTKFLYKRIETLRFALKQCSDASNGFLRQSASQYADEALEADDKVEDDDNAKFGMCPNCEKVFPKTEMYHEEYFDEDSYYCDEDCFFWHMNALKGQSIEIREKIAELAHRQWSGWMRYLFSKGSFNRDGSWTMPEEFVNHWKRQTATQYSKLSHSEKESDRKEADKYLGLFMEIIEETRKDGEDNG